MKLQGITTAALLCALAAPGAQAFKIGSGVTVRGSIQADILFPQYDAKIGTEKTSEDIQANIYADVQAISKYVDGGIRLEYLEHPLPGFRPGFKGWGLSNIFVKGKYKGFELTAGDFYEQFGSGFILRAYEERSLGVDNSIRGGRLKVNAIDGVRLTALGGVQRRYWDWSTRSSLFGADGEIDLDRYIKSMDRKNMKWMFGASWILKHERDELVPVDISPDYALRVPMNVNAFDVRTRYSVGGFSALAEYAWKSQDPSRPNGYIYKNGSAAMLSLTYSKKGLSALLQAKRSENMDFRSLRSGAIADQFFINNMPAFAYQHTYSLASMYPYATQAAGGEWAFEGNFAYKFPRNTPLGGKYGTKITFNASVILGLDKSYYYKEDLIGAPGSTQYGTDGYTSAFFKMGQRYYEDYNIQIEKKFSRVFNMTFMYMFQRYNNAVLKTSEEGDKTIYSNIFVYDGRYRLSNKFILRTELQYLHTRQDLGQWVYGLAELAWLPYMMFSVSDQWNTSHGTHYYMAAITGNYKANRLMVSYGLTRAGYNCSGGVCRYVPATKGFQISYNYTF